MKSKIQCVKCGDLGRLENYEGKRYRINHDIMIKGEKFPKRCYVGNLETTLKKFQSVMKIRPDIIDENVYNEIKSYLKKYENTQDERYDILVKEILNISTSLGKGWFNQKHHLVKQDNCPYCKNQISVRFTRAGKSPTPSKGKYSIEDLKIGKGKSTRTTVFSENGLYSNTIEKRNKKKPRTYTK